MPLPVSRVALLYAALVGLGIFAIDLLLDWAGGATFVPGHGLLVLGAVGLLYLILSRDLRAREQAEARLADLVDSVVDAIVAIDEQERIFLFNQGAQRMFGYRPEEVLGQPLDRLLPAGAVAAHHAHVSEFGRAPDLARFAHEGLAVAGRRKDGSEFPAEASLSRSRLGGRLVFTAIVHDVSQRKVAEQALQRAHAELEQRVLERTEALTQANAALQAEIAERTRVEAELEALVGEHDRQRQHAQALALEAQFRADELGAVFTAITDPVIVCDADGKILRSNPAAASAFGLPLRPNGAEAGAPIAVRASDRQPIPWENRPLARALRGETVKAERLILIGRDGQESYVLASASPLFRGEAASGAVVVWHDLTEHERLTVLEERQHLARELHDSLTQVLYGIALGAHTARTWLDSNRAKALEALDYIITLGETGLSEMRALIFDLRPEALEREGLVKALSMRATAVRARFELEVNVELCAEPDVPLATKEALYRIAQEMVHNVVQHAYASRLDIRLGHDADGLLLEIADNGVGFDPCQTFNGHLGLRSMAERARVLGGSLQIDSAPGKGTRVHLRLPPAR